MSATAAALLPNIHSLSDSERKSFIRNKFSATSRFQREFKGDAIERDCSMHATSLRAQVIRLLEAKGLAVPGGKLETLHEHIPAELKDYNYNDGVNKITSYLYDTDAAFTREYHRFVKEVVQAIFPYPFYFQATPTVRLHCPGGENSNHYPRYHTDIGYGHPPEEINIWMPLTVPAAPQYHGFRRTDVAHSRTILEEFDFDFAPFIERAVNDKPFNHTLDKVSPQVTTPFGKMTAFDSRSIHTGEPLEKHTRASIDIRIIPVEDFESLPVEYQGTGRKKMRYVPGHGYHPLSSQELKI